MFADLLHTHLRGLVELSPQQIQQLQTHFDLLNRWNRVINLTSIRDPDQIVERHYCESLFLAAHLPPTPLNIADLGSGAGFPGIPIAVYRPEYRVDLIESNQKKSAFLHEASRHLPNVRVTAKRAENIAGRFDWAVSRAVKFKNIARVTAAISDYIAVLGGPEQPESRSFTWNDPIRLPWGSQRFLWLGSKRFT